MRKLQIGSVMKSFTSIAVADFHGRNCAKTLHVVSEIRKHSIQCRGAAVRAHSGIINSIIPEQKRMEIPRRQYVKFRSKI